MKGGLSLNMDQHLNNLKKNMEKTIFKDSKLSTSEKNKIYTKSVHSKVRQRRYVFAPIISIVFVSCLLIAGTFLFIQFFSYKDKEFADSDRTEFLTNSNTLNQMSDTITATYEETVYYIPFNNYNTPVVDENKLFIQVNGSRNDYLDIDTLIQYDLKSGEYIEIYESSYSSSNMMNTGLNENWIIWLDQGRNDKSKILSLNRSTNEIETIVETIDENEKLLTPTLYKDYITWIYVNESTKTVEVRLHNLSTNKTFIVANVDYNPEYYPTVYIGEGKLLWTSNKGDKGYYYLYDLKSKNTERYEAPKPFVLYVKYSKGKIYSLNSNGIVYPEKGSITRYWEGLTYGYLNIKEQKFYSINSEGERAQFDAHNNKMLVLLNKGKTLYIYENHKGDLIKSKVKLRSGDKPSSAFFDNNGNIIINYISNEEDYEKNQIKIGIIEIN